MTDTLQPAGTTRTFDSLDPATGDVVDTHPVTDKDGVDAAVARARTAAGWWSELSFDERADVLLTWRSVITRRIAQLADLVHRETGKPHGDAQLEIVLAVDHIAWAAKHARKVLGPRRVSAGLLMANQAASVEYHPLGVVGVIGPWNYPVFTPMGSIAYALAAGNTVVFKPSEYTPGVGRWLADSLREVVHGRDVLQVVTGLGETGNALCTAAIDKLAFTGSARTGKLVMAACAENLTPVLIEAGGKDSVIVDEDADLTKAAEAALWGGMSNAGQTCIGTERVYVHEKVFDDFMGEILSQARGLRAGADPDAKIGPITMPSQLAVIRSHLEDALAKGARVALGGPDAVGDRFVQPTILTHVPEDSTAITEETFGPTLAINPVTDMDEAVRRTNATEYGLAGAVFSRANGVAIARRIRSGMTSVNSVIAFAAVPSLPFGGVGQSGFGRIHGADGLKEFTYAKAITRQRFRPVMNLTSFARDAATDGKVAQLVTLLHGGKQTLR
ncbi:aldehyde dehydrogenase [Nocardioides flavus (ex Wang et al. 2016)]|uniref:Aldehyde dehydrogenase n=1 Tax=Nocardioides flavus (ex Wang et al. 2016) TaxID=2058780 RepID=A0ABQ3HP28_9ACTN|nr:aldehyde dehydrogenase family protein [Nocardioides flavus (ex Wang et al. 2016)]GHE19438.1 aldehyde dehydrogenase [Nocardioides flavus (ex Wang et al. 2016)]